ncbi:oxygenase MpaB family protein [Nocardia farcinica]|uniref:oxygenase MpaB family protein n=1 Tax=Nocardia farcinica TaxID=37329 RepID=UPI0024580DC4|nr:oxygenase MpaB family protein [Nocardia farcinica]
MGARNGVAVDTDIIEAPAPAGLPIGPGSLTWKYAGDWRNMLFLGRTGILQNMHPAVGAALQQHSNFFDNPWDRLVRSVPQIQGMIYDADNEAQAGRVRDYHKLLKGEDSRGRRYHALNPEVYWWTHATFIELSIAINEFFGTPLTAAEKDQLIAEGITWWRMYGLSDRVLVSNYAEFKEYWDRTIDEVLEANATTDFALRLDRARIPTVPGIPEPVWSVIWRPVMAFNLWLANGLMPERAREILGMRWGRVDQAVFGVFCAAIRHTWPLLPERLRYAPRAYAGIKRVRSAQAH